MSVRGTVIRRGKKWAVVLDLGRDPAGKRVRHWHSGYATERDAERERTRLLASIDGGAYVAPNRDTVGPFLESWLDSTRSTVRPTTHNLYRTLVEAYVVPRIGAVRLAELTPAMLNKLYGDLLADGRRQGKGGALSPVTVRKVHAVIYRALRAGVKWGELARNVAESSDPPKVRKTEQAVWTNEQASAFLAGIADDRLAALWRTLVLTGLRRGEVCGLRWSDLDLDGGTLNVRQVAAMVGSTLTFTEPKTARSRRPVSLDPATVAALRSHRARQAAERLAWGEAWHDGGFVFTREDGRPLRPPTVTKRFKRLVADLNLPALGSHGLRHSHLTSLLRAGQPVHVVSARAGHSSAAVTLSVYAHVLPGDDQAAASVAASLLDG